MLSALEPSTPSLSDASPNGSTAVNVNISILQRNLSTPSARMTIPLPQLLFQDPFSRSSSLEVLSHKFQSPFDSTSCQPHTISLCSSYGPYSHMAHHDSPHSSGSSLTSRANSATEAQPQDVAHTLSRKSSLKRKRDSKLGADAPPLEGTVKTTREAPKKKKANRGRYFLALPVLVHYLITHCRQLAFTARRRILPATIHDLVNVA